MNTSQGRYSKNAASSLVRTGKVRVAFVVTPLFAAKETATGELRGVAIELGRALAARIGVEFVAVAYPNFARILETGGWDIAFVGIDPSRAAQVDFSSPYMQVDYTYLVQADSSIRNVADGDQSGVRIAAIRNGTVDLALRRILKRAGVVGAETLGAAFELLRDKKADALAASRQTLLEYSNRLPGSRVVEGRFHAALESMAVPKGHLERLGYINEFVEEAKASGLVQRAIDIAGLRGVHVAPSPNPDVPK